MRTETVTKRVDLSDLRIEDRPRRGGVGRFLLVLIALGSIGGAYYLGRRTSVGGAGALSGPVEVRVETVGAVSGGERRDRSGDFAEGGWIEVPSYYPIVVSALVPGRVEELLVLEGAPVGLGTTVARLYSKDRKDALRVKQAAVGRAQARLDLLLAGYRKEDVAKARAEVDRLSEEVALAEKVLARTRGLVPTGAASEEELERHESALRVAEAARRSAAEDLARLGAGFRPEEIAEARAEVAAAEAARDLAKSEFDHCEVKSPAKGVVLERYVTPGTWISAQNPRIVSLYDPNDLQVRVDVRQENASRVHVGQKVEILTDAEPERAYGGTVIRVDPLADLRKNTVQAKIKLTETGPRLHPEMICTARFLVEQPAEETPTEPPPGEAVVLTVSRDALVKDGGRTYLFTVRDKKARRIEVRTGEAAGVRVVIVSGIAEGDRVILSPPEGLEDGDAVEVTGR